MRLTILSVAYPLAPVGPDAVGGAEQILSRLDEALMHAGHRSIVIACAGSLAIGRLIATPATAGQLSEEVRKQAEARHRQAIMHTLETLPIDVVHMHGVDFLNYLPPLGPPVLATLHLPPSWYDADVFRIRRPRTFLQCVSVSQRRSCPPCEAMLPEIANGVPLPASQGPKFPRRFALALGRLCPEKGFHLAMDAAARAGVPLYLAGAIYRYPSHEAYFAQEIRPRLDAMRRFIGPIGGERKRCLLSAAHCLLVPSLAPETSSLAAMEALACGTPVIAFPAGALPEIIEHGRTGFIVNDVNEMAKAIVEVDRIDPDRCREAARVRFSLERMTAEYLSLYQSLAVRFAAPRHQVTKVPERTLA